jgi:hypothetical protein
MTLDLLYELIEERKHQILLAILGLVIVSGIFYSLYLGDSLRFLPDELDYYTLAENLVTKRVYSLDGNQPTAYRPPGYPLFLSLPYLMGARIVHLRIFNFLILGCSIYIIYRTLLDVSSPFSAVVGIFLVVFYPVAFFTAGTLYPQTLATLLFLVACYLLTRNPRGTLDYLFSGLILGYLVLTIPTFVIVFPVFGIWHWLNRKESWLIGFTITLVSAIFVVSIWTIRNYKVFDHIVFVSTNSGENLLLGNSENTTSSSGSQVDISKYVAEASNLNEIERDQFYRGQALDYMMSHKFQTIKMYFFKFLNFFNFRNDLVTKDEQSTLGDILMLITYGPLLLLTVFRLLLAKTYRLISFEVLMIFLYIGAAFTSALFFTRIRFRIPFDFLLIMIIALLVNEVFSKQVEKMRVESRSHSTLSGRPDSPQM